MSTNKRVTINKTGAEVLNISNISKQAIDDASKINNVAVAEIGCCYGNFTKKLLKKTPTADVMVMDLEIEHLNVLKSEVSADAKLTYLHGKFPNDFNLFEKTIDIFHCTHMLQFLSGAEIMLGLEKAYHSLKKGGRIYLTTTSVYCPWLEDWQDSYFKIKKEAKLQWPGEIDNFHQVIPPEYKQYIGNFFHPLEKDILERALITAGFTINTAYYYDLDNPDDFGDSPREMIGVIASKS